MGESNVECTTMKILVLILVISIVAINALPQNSASCTQSVRSQCRKIYGTKTPNRASCSDCDKCDQCGGLGILKVFLGSTAFVKDIEFKCNNFCKGGASKCINCV